MRTLTSDADLADLKKDRALVSVYVDHGYDPKNIEMVLGMKNAFDAHVGDAWHMLIPCQEGFGVDSWMGPEQFGHQLNRALIQRYQVVEKDLPALVFEFDADNEYFHIPLGDRSDQERTTIIRTIAEFANEAVKSGPNNVLAFRNSLHEQIAMYGFQLRALRIVSRTSSRIAALIGLGSNLKGLIVP